MGIKEDLAEDVGEVLSGLYVLLKSIPLHEWRNLTLSSESENLKAILILPENSTDASTLGLSILGKYAHSSDEEAFITCLVQSRLPDIMLSSSEQKMIENGFLSALKVAKKVVYLSVKSEGIAIWWDNRPAK